MRGSTVLPNSSILDIIASVSPPPGSARDRSRTPTPIVARLLDLLDHAVRAAAEADRQMPPTLARRFSPPTLRLSCSMRRATRRSETAPALCAAPLERRLGRLVGLRQDQLGAR
jgi:hypothetical protein